MMTAKKSQIQPFTSINQTQSATKEEKPVTETIDVFLYGSSNFQTHKIDDTRYLVYLCFLDDSLGIREQIERYS